ncbi:hypothetical protein SLEP1_g33375 [Rubroshorea leprosula]|uniref:Uncharacterized protein n=1 Tax=Rubroshorea leprosula TaxID=152421 RepID=A0AAV5KGD8_9ROSI|nr:hypothetical protein SLEP1_g33375 [Rubroshorea leprosula]
MGELGHLVENYGIVPHVLVRLIGSEELACLAPRDHWMPLYAHYLAVGLRFPILELLVALLKEYGLGLTQLVSNGIRLVVGFLGRGDGEIKELSRWKGKRRNPNHYQLGKVEKDEVERLERGGGELMNIMYLTSPEVVESSGIYGRSSLSREEMNRLRAGGKTVRLSEKRSKVSALGAQEERVGGGSSRPHLGGGPRAEVGPNSKPRKGTIEEIDPALREVEAMALGREKSFVPYPRQVASFYESGRTVAKRFIGSHILEVATNGGSGVVWQALERIALVKKNEELSHQNEEVEKNFGELTSELEKVKEELANSKRLIKLEEQKRKKCEEALARRDCELAKVMDLYRLPTLVMAFTDCRKKVKAQNLDVDMISITFGPEEIEVEENGDSKTTEFHPEVKLTWEWDEAGNTILSPTLDFEFVAVDEEEADNM